MKAKISIIIVLLLGIVNIQAQTWKEIQKIYPNSNSYSNNFGYSVAIDGNYAVVGAYKYMNNMGCAYVFKNSGTSWQKVAKLLASDGSEYARFGFSVNISGDNIVIGAPQANSQGIAYIFEKPTNGWTDMTETAKLVSSDIAKFDFFGGGVCIAGNTVAISASENDDDKGAVYIYEKPINGWSDMTENLKVTASDGNDGDKFGAAVDISDEYLIVGSTHQNNKGAVYIFEKSGNSWLNISEIAKLRALNAFVDDEFGNSVSISGDIIVVGSYYSDAFYTNAGCAYIFEKPTTGWTNMTETAQIRASDAIAGANFGTEVSISGDVVVVGTPKINSLTGAVYVFEKPTNGWINMTETEKIIAADHNNVDFFGHSVDVSDGIILIGSYGDDDIAPDGGSAYLYRKNNDNIEDNIQENVVIYPNPVNKILNIYFPVNKIQKLTLTDASGKIIFTKTNVKQNEKIDFSNYEKGIYVLMLFADNKVITRKIMKK